MARHQTKFAKTVGLATDSEGNFRYPRGWHCIGVSADFEINQPKSLSYFGTKIVAFRGEGGDIHALDGYCPHLGADLGTGEVIGDTIRCPFHHWSWGTDGQCKEIPYAKTVPSKAVTGVWQIKEQDGVVYVWNDPEGQMPDQELPVIEQCNNSEWSDWYWAKTTIATNQRELMDNVADVAHFGPVHNAPIESFSTEFSGNKSIQTMEGTSEELAGGGSLKTVATYYGPSRQDCAMTGGPVESYTLNLHTAIDEQNFDLWYGVIVKRQPGQTKEEASQTAQAYAEAATDQFYEDVAIWREKTFIQNPILCDGDGPFHRLRTWYEQFYVDRADVDSRWKTI